MENRLQELTNKLLNEGVEAGKTQAGQIVAEANGKASSIVEEAKKEAETIVQNAKKEAQALNDNTRSELQMFAQQSVNALKTQITDVLNEATVKDVVSKLTADKDFMNGFIVELAKKWGAEDALTINAKDAESLKAVFAAKAKELLDGGLKIQEVNGQKAAFSIQPQNGSYKVNFGDEDFENYFKSFLRPQLVEMLFGK